MVSKITRLKHGLARHVKHFTQNRQIVAMAKNIARNAPSTSNRPVIFFNASTRLSGVSLNAAFSLLSAWGLRLTGIPVVHFVCQSGMSRCILGTDRTQSTKKPPCHQCFAQSKLFYTNAHIVRMCFQTNADLAVILQDLSLNGLMDFEYNNIPFGKLILPSLRWILRRFHLEDNESTRSLFTQYILSAWNIAQSFNRLIEDYNPQAVVVFNGIVFPEAVVRFISQEHGIPVITHEVNLLPYSAFFTHRDATFRTVEIPVDFKLSPAQETRLDAYLEQRFQGNFTMAGVDFWPQIQSLGEEFKNKAARFRQIIPVFSNVIFDTTQDHANTVFTHMFDWLDHILKLIHAHPETLFVIRAHPDESRPGKESLESVADWARRNRINDLQNVHFVDATEYLNSYQLIQQSRFVMVYTSTIGLEATLMGVPVIAGGASRYNTSQLPTVYFPSTPADFLKQSEIFLAAQTINLPQQFRINARRYLYYEIFRAALPFADYLKEDGIWRGYVALKSFPWQALLSKNSITIRTIIDGIMNNEPFLIPE